MVQILSCKDNYTLLKKNYLIFGRNSDVDLKLFQDKCYCFSDGVMELRSILLFKWSYGT